MAEELELIETTNGQANHPQSDRSILSSTNGRAKSPEASTPEAVQQLAKLRVAEVLAMRNREELPAVTSDYELAAYLSKKLGPSTDHCFAVLMGYTFFGAEDLRHAQKVSKEQAWGEGVNWSLFGIEPVIAKADSNLAPLPSNTAFVPVVIHLDPIQQELLIQLPPGYRTKSEPCAEVVGNRLYVQLELERSWNTR